MRIEHLLNETQVIPNFDTTVSYSDLTPQQLATLRKINDGEVSSEVASPKTLEIIGQLEELGLIDCDEVTDAGNKILDIYNERGGLKPEIDAAGDYDAKLGRSDAADPIDTSDLDDSELDPDTQALNLNR